MRTKRLFKVFFVFIIMFLSSIVFAKEDVVISDVVILKTAGKASELSKPSFSGNNIDFNVRFEDVKDEIDYKITVTNSSSKDYTIEFKKDFLNSEYFSYDYSFNGGDFIIEANSNKTIDLKIMYKEEVAESKLKNGIFYESNNFEFGLVANQVNPETGSLINIFLLIVVFLFLLTILLVCFKKYRKYSIISYLIIMAFLIIPSFTGAIDSFDITINTKIEVNKAGYFYVYHSSDNSIEKFYMSDYQDKTLDITKLVKENYLYAGYYRDYSGKGSYAGDGVDVSDGIPYDDKVSAWGDDYYTESGMKIVPEVGKTYYLKELKNSYLRNYNYIFFNIHSLLIDRLLFFSAVDDNNYSKVGFVINGERKEVPVLKLLYSISSSEGVVEKLTAKSTFGKYGINRGYLFEFDDDAYVVENLKIDVVPYFVTMDGIYVESYYLRSFFTGNLIKDDGFSFGIDPLYEDRKVVEYSSLT